MNDPDAMFIGLGMRKGTKAKRAQCIILRDARATVLVRWLKASTKPDELLFPYSYESYRRLLKLVVRDDLKLDINWSPHSPRSGFATDCIIRGVPFMEIKERGRWLSESSLRTYLDVVSASSINASLATSQLTNSIAYVQTHFYSFFPGSNAFQQATDSWGEQVSHGDQGYAEGRGRALSSGVGDRLGADARRVSVQTHIGAQPSSDPSADGTNDENVARGRGRGSRPGRFNRDDRRGR